MEGRAVVEQQRRARGQARDQPVPHHPAAGGEIEQPVAGLDVAVEPMLLQMLEQRAAGAVHDAFRHAGRARGIQDVERMVEGQPREGDRRRRRRAAMKSASRTALGSVREIRRVAEIGQHDDALDAGQLRQAFADAGQRIEALAAIAIAVGGEQQLGRDLAEAVEHALHAEIRRAGGPDGARGWPRPAWRRCVSGMLGTKPATRSPGPTPAARIAWARRETRS